MNKDLKNFEEKRKKALKESINEGAASGFSVGIANSYITPFALKLTDSAANIGYLSSLSGLAAPLAQILGSNFMEKFPRKKIVLWSVFIQTMLWLPIALVAWFAYKNIYPSSLIYVLIILYTLLVSFGGIANPSWFSWMGDIVKKDEKGNYFGKRNLVSGVFELASVIIALVILKRFENTTYAVLGFGIIFILCFVSRLISYELLRYQFIPHLRPIKSYRIKIKDFMKNNKSFKYLALYQMFFNMAIWVASPFFAMYMLQDLGFSYKTYIIVTMSSAVFYLAFTPLVGKISDKYGNLRLLYIANIAFVLSPLAWIFIKNPIVLVVIPQLIAGIANAALVIGLTNFSYDALKGEERGLGIAYLNVFVGIGTFIGSIFGGLILQYGNISFINRFFFVFALASGLRFLVALFFLPKIKEQKKVSKLPYIPRIAPSIHSTHTEVKNFVFYLQEKESEGLKVFTPSNKDVLRKER